MSQTTLVRSKHAPGRAMGGVDNCSARGGNDGECPGVQTAAWLNGLGPDDKVYATQDGVAKTCLDVRRNWVTHGDNHVVWAV